MSVTTPERTDTKRGWATQTRTRGKTEFSSISLEENYQRYGGLTPCLVMRTITYRVI